MSDLPEPDGFIKCCFSRNITLHKKFYLPVLYVTIFLIILFLLGIFIALPFSADKDLNPCETKCIKYFDELTNKTKTSCEYKDICKYAVIIPIGLLICVCSCYIGIVLILFLQKSNSCSSPVLIKKFILNHFCLPCCCCALYLSDKKEKTANDCTCIPVLPNIYCVNGHYYCDGDGYISNGSKITFNLTSIAMFPLTIFLIVIYLIGLIIFVIGWCIWGVIRLFWKFVKWIYNNNHCKCSLAHCNFFNCIEIDKKINDKPVDV